MLVFLNACRTAEAEKKGDSFLGVLDQFDSFRGAILTEQQTIDHFANEFGLAFLDGFLHRGEAVGDLLHRLRLDHAPLGLIYGVHCPPDIRVRVGPAAEVSAGTAIHEIAAAGEPGRILGARAVRRRGAAPGRVATLPEQPYPSLGPYDERSRLLFTGARRTPSDAPRRWIAPTRGSSSCTARAAWARRRSSARG